MDVNTVLMQLVTEFNSLPVMKLIWSCQLQMFDSCSDIKISPSHYLRELSYNSDERQALLAEQHKTLKFSSYGFKITVEPSILVFQNYKAGDKLSASITVRNIDKGMQKITFNMDENGSFLIDENASRIVRLASGMITSITIHFKPKENGDYYHKVIIHINGSRIAIPVIGFGVRGILDFPDKINFGKVPIKFMNKRLTPVVNIGNKTAKFIVSASGPFSVIPEKGIVLPNDSLSFTLSFNSNFLGPATGFLRVKYENGEEVYVELQADAITLDITLHPRDVECDDTYLGMLSKAKVTIRNNTRFKAKYCWRSHISSAYFFETRSGSNDKTHFLANGEHVDDHKRHLYSQGDTFGISKIIHEQKENHGAHSEKQEPLYADEAFRIEPPIGEFEAQSSTEFLVFFSPTRSGMFFSEAFCDIAGLEERLPMQITGRGLGPKFKFGFDVLEIGELCLGGGHKYEIPVMNSSEVSGTINFVGFVGLIEGEFSVNPPSITLGPGEYAAFFAFLKPIGKPVSLFEELNFKVGVTDELVSVTIKGEVIFPGIKFADTDLKFGEVSYGFPEVRQVVLINDSMIPLDISLSVEPNGTDKVLNADDIMRAIREPNFAFPANPQEFEIEPSRFTLSSRGFQRITVRMTAANYGDYTRTLSVRIGEDSEIMKQLPVEALCVVPTLIKPDSPIEVDCVSGFPSPASLTIHNPSAFSCVYCCVPVASEYAQFTSDEFLGIAKAREPTTILFNVTAKTKGQVQGKIELFAAGKTEPILDILVTCHVITAIGALKLSRKLIDLGACALRAKTTDTFKIINATLVSIPYTITMTKSGPLKDIWEANTVVGIAKPEPTDNKIEVSVTLNEVGAHVGHFFVRIPGIKEILDVEVTATGVGCPLIFEPNLAESGVIDFGYLFTNTATVLSYEATNPGLFTKHLEWKHEKDDPPVNPDIFDGKKVKKIELDKLLPKKVPKTKISTFEIIPMKKVILGEETMSLTIKAYSTVAKSFEANFILWAYAEVPKNTDRDFQKRIAKAKIILAKHTEINAADNVYIPIQAQTLKIVAEFLVPKLFFSQYSVSFRLDQNPTDYENIFLGKSSIVAENPCNSPLSVIFHTKLPFGIIVLENVVDEWKYTFEPKEKLNIFINFDCSRLPKDTGVTTFDGTLDCIYEKHPTSDESIKLSAKLYFATLELECDVIDFGEVTNGKEAVAEFNVTNPGKFCIVYKVYIVPNSVSMEIVNPIGTLDVLQEFDLLYTSSDIDMFEQEYLQEKNNEFAAEDTMTPCESRDSFATNLEAFEDEKKEGQMCQVHKDSMGFFYEKLYRFRMMTLLGLRDPEQEANDELTYFHYYPDKPETSEDIIVPPNEIIDIIPATGIIQAGCSQKITVVFYAQSNIHLQATVCFSIENGTAKFLIVKGKSITPPSPYAYLNTANSLC